MRRAAVILVYLLVPWVASANPVMLNPGSLTAFGVTALAALFVEAGIVALLLVFSGLAPVRIMSAFFFANLAVFAFIFSPLLDGRRVPLAALEALVVALDAAAIKLLSCFDSLQADGYHGVGWVKAAVIAAVGNSASYWMGAVMNDAPWLVHATEE